MSRSDPHPSSTAEPPRRSPLRAPTRSEPDSDPENADADVPAAGSAVARPRKSLSTQFAAAIRWLHIYISLLGFTALTFFAVTGVTLNHPSWFGVDDQRVTEYTGELRTEWMGAGLASDASEPDPIATADASDPVTSSLVAKLEIVEHLRSAHGIRGAVSEFRIDEAELLVLFKGPGYAADSVIDRKTGSYTITETVMGAVAVINDLHKGRDSGPAWSLLIDVTAVLMVLVSITGIILIFYLRRRRFSGIVTAVVGTILVAIVFVLWVP